MREFDIVYLTNTPSFYKLNLCEAIAMRGVRLLIVFYGYDSEAVNTSITERTDWSFDFEFIHLGDSHRRNFFTTMKGLIRLMRGIKTQKIIYAGWLAPEYNIYSFLSPKAKNVMVCESSILDVSLSGIKGWIKRAVIGRMSSVLPSGEPHKELFDSIQFRGQCYVTGSVGIFNKSGKRKTVVNQPLRFLYVGRLIDAKNVEMLIDVFNSNGLPLTIAGAGKLKTQLQQKAKANISFVGFIPNDKIGDLYCDHDVFVLPSKYEPWGLVVEEALYRGLLVIVSDKVGSHIDMVKKLHTGVVFESGNSVALQAAIDSVVINYDVFRQSVCQIDWQERENRQVEAYLNVLK